MTDTIIVLVVLAIVGAAGFYVWKAKKNGKTCIGCPSAGSCSACKNGGCGCGK